MESIVVGKELADLMIKTKRRRVLKQQYWNLKQ